LDAYALDFCRERLTAFRSTRGKFSGTFFETLTLSGVFSLVCL
jgi:hypothetical protein